MNKLYYVVIGKSWVSSHKLINNTTVPLIKLKCSERYLNFNVDISIEDGHHFGLKTVDLIKSYLNYYKILEPLIIALKHILAVTGLNSPYSGGLSSYGLILMLVSFIQSQIDKKRINLEEKNVVGLIFLRFLHYYGLIFDYKKYAIICNKIDGKSEEINIECYYNNEQLVIIDPLNKNNNVAKSTFNYPNIKIVFMIAYFAACESSNCGCYKSEFFCNDKTKTECCILNRIFNSVKRLNNNENN